VIGVDVFLFAKVDEDTTTYFQYEDLLGSPYYQWWEVSIQDTSQEAIYSLIGYSTILTDCEDYWIKFYPTSAIMRGGVDKERMIFSLGHEFVNYNRKPPVEEEWVYEEIVDE
jgi:hypothetical protein